MYKDLNMYKSDYKLPDFMNLTSFWMNDITDAKQVILSDDAIHKFNLNLKPMITSLYNLANEDDIISFTTLTKYIQSYELPKKDMYNSNGDLLTDDYFKEIFHNTNLDVIKKCTQIRYGMSIRKTSVRSFPIETPIFSSIEHSIINNFDRFQETGCFAFEALLIYHESFDKKWYFVKFYNYFGWIKTEDIAISEDKKQIFDYTQGKDFLRVISKETNLSINDKNSSPITIKCGMGTRLCILNNNHSSSPENYIVKFPTRGSDGSLIFKEGIISNSDDITYGNLPYTRYNIIDQALKFIDTPYDWGDKFSGKDCSSFILAVYKCFGFSLPRNADQQENSFFNTDNSFIFNKDDTLKDRYSKMDKLKPGAAIFQQGHVMMYLGKYNDTYYMIHSFSGYSVKKDSSYETRNALLVAISTIELLTASGLPIIQKFTSCVQFQ
ncbi:SH3 domain-containing protein [Clostridium lacusfryxellense]|uniref:SH3 domain-containing protein n=1 Tax=Clostridium lacusfryxellense TaxID=205328 RepID=UPI001C0CF9E3|nr:SH3 domain-containing protein [Clostridium lacusfryxellense]MBU3109959.1 SH3 domain-containing protein [Clostridium lacusfryxellense]